MKIDLNNNQNQIKQARSVESIVAIRGIISRSKEANLYRKQPITPKELDRRTRVTDELTAETERLGLYK